MTRHSLPITPGALCLVTGVPPGSYGSHCNGIVLTAVQRIDADGVPCWLTDPAIICPCGCGRAMPCDEIFLRPLTPPTHQNP